jgi:PleD family two-component response regulator
MSSIEYDRNTPEQQVHYILIDRNGPLAEFETWEDAFHCMSTRKVEGGSIVRCDGPVGASARSQTPRAMPEQPLPTPTKKVLVISEDVSTLLSLARMVKAAGHAVAIGGCAAEAVQTIGLEKPDLVIVDVDPTARTADDGWDGFHVVDWLRCHYPDRRAKFIVVSGADPERLGPGAGGTDGCAFVRKPIVERLLLTAVRRAIGGSPELERSEAGFQLMDLS